MMGIKELAAALGANGALTALNLSSNRLKDEGVSAVCETIQSNKETKLASLNFGNNGIGPVGANAVAAMVAVTGGLTSIDLSRNQLCGIWADREGVGYQHGTYTAEGITAIADALHVNGALTSLELRGNYLRDKGWGAIFAAICGNKDSKIMSLDAVNESISPAGVKLIAEALRTSVTGSLTVTNLLGNQLITKSAEMLAEVAKQKGISLCGIKRDQTTADFSKKRLQPPDAILLASDLSQAVVTGVLTKLNLKSNSCMGDAGKQAMRDAVKDRSRFELEL
jgi:hypothetical protein